MSIKSRLIPPTASLIAFEAAARWGSLTKAADELCVTTTAVSKQVKRLESFLNTPLFIRSKQGVQLTEQGYRYLNRANEALDILAEETRLLDAPTTTCALNIEVGSCFMHFWLLPKLEQFRQIHPEILFNLNINNEPYVGSHESCDVVFIYSLIDSYHRANDLLFDERALLVCSPLFLENRGGSIELSTIFDLPLIMLKDELPFWEGWQSWSSKMKLSYHMPHDALLVDDQVAVVQAAINDAGVALVWDWHVRDLLATGQLVALTDCIDFTEKAYFLSVTDNCTNPAANFFVNWVKKQECQYQVGNG